MDNNIRLHWELGGRELQPFSYFFGKLQSGELDPVRVTSAPSLTHTNTNIQHLWLEMGMGGISEPVMFKVPGFYLIYLFTIFLIYFSSSILIKFDSVGAVKFFCIQDNWKIRTVPTRDENKKFTLI